MHAIGNSDRARSAISAPLGPRTIIAAPDGTSRDSIDCDQRRQYVLAVCREMHLVVGGVAALDADERAPRRVAHVAHGARLFLPQIPQDRRGCLALLDADAPLPIRIFNRELARRVEIDAVGLAGKLDADILLGFALCAVDFVDVSGTGEPGHRY